MATDSKGNAVQFGDYVTAQTENGALTVVRIVKLAESPKGVTAVGAYVDLVGNGRIKKVPVDINGETLVMKSDGSLPTK